MVVAETVVVMNCGDDDPVVVVVLVVVEMGLVEGAGAGAGGVDGFGAGTL